MSTRRQNISRSFITSSCFLVPNAAIPELFERIFQYTSIQNIKLLMYLRN